MTTLRLLALDLDGTILDATGSVAPEVRDAVAAARERGLHVVLCTGRRYRTTLPVARELGLSGAAVVNNGVLVKDLDSGRTLHSNFLPAAVYRQVVGFLRAWGPPLVYVDAHDEGLDIFTERKGELHDYQGEYLADNVAYTEVVDDLTILARDDVIMASVMGESSALVALRRRVPEVFGETVRTHSLVNKNYRGDILELLSPRSGKWGALRRLAAGAGIGPEAIAAVGDDANDVEMIREAGFGVAMGNALPAAREAADEVVASSAEGGAVQAIELVLRRS